MKLRSLQFQFLITVISAILAITVFIGGLSIYEVDQFVRHQTDSLVNATCQNEATQINRIFSDMEKSVKIIESYVLNLIKSEADILDRDKQKKIIEYADSMFVDVAKHTNGAIAYYLRFDPGISTNTAGFFYTRIDNSEEYFGLAPTNLSIYDKDDTEHVGWFWQPYEAGEPVWMKPYYNQNNNILMISYVVPLYFEDQFFGIVGMDFDYTVLTDKVQEIKVYEHGSAHLELDGVPVYRSGYGIASIDSDPSDDYLTASESLINGMNLILSASYTDIRQIRYDIALDILFVMVLLMVLFSAITIIIVKKIVTPLNKLTDASKQLANGNYDVEITHSNTYEVNLLSTTFENMAMNLREHQKLQHMLAFRDSLTGLRNTTSYESWVSDFNREIQSSNVDFGVVVLDVNWLKESNDVYGHDMGNKLLITSAQIIASTFKRSPVFRIGGDEFLVILQDADLAGYEKLFATFDSTCANMSIDSPDGYLPVSIAKGFARYKPGHDTQFADVFNRADDAMYKNKREMKSTPFQSSARK